MLFIFTKEVIVAAACLVVIRVSVCLLLGDWNLFLRFIEPDQRMWLHFPDLELVLEWDLNQGDRCELGVELFSIHSFIMLRLGILCYVHNLEGEERQSQHFLLSCVPRHLGSLHLNCSGWVVLLGQVDLEDQEFTTSLEGLSLWLIREINGNASVSGA